MSAAAILTALLSAFLSGFLLPLARDWLAGRTKRDDDRNAGAAEVIAAAAVDAAEKEKGYAEILADDRGRDAVVERLRHGPPL